MRTISVAIACLLFAGCTTNTTIIKHPVKPVVALKCDQTDYPIKPLPKIITKDRLIVAYNQLVVSREKVLEERDQCANNEHALVEQLNRK